MKNKNKYSLFLALGLICGLLAYGISCQKSEPQQPKGPDIETDLGNGGDGNGNGGEDGNGNGGQTETKLLYGEFKPTEEVKLTPGATTQSSGITWDIIKNEGTLNTHFSLLNNLRHITIPSPGIYKVTITLNYKDENNPAKVSLSVLYSDETANPATVSGKSFYFKQTIGALNGSDTNIYDLIATTDAGTLSISAKMECKSGATLICTDNETATFENLQVKIELLPETKNTRNRR